MCKDNKIFKMNVWKIDLYHRQLCHILSQCDISYLNIKSSLVALTLALIFPLSFHIGRGFILSLSRTPGCPDEIRTLVISIHLTFVMVYTY